MSDRHDVINATIKAHRKRTIERCDCGWDKLGQDHADHLALAIEAGCHFYDMGQRDVGTTLDMIRATLAIVEAPNRR